MQEHVNTEEQEEPGSQEEKKYPEWDGKVKGFYFAAMAFILLGIYKRFVYVSPDESDVPMNAYVGGDAYNYIINGTHTIAYFVLALLCALVASTILISNHLYALKVAIQEGKNA